jgi:GTPase
MPDTEKPRFVSGFISILGRPNAGKSTLLNALTGAKLAIVSEKPQTTRTLIQSVVTLPNAQIVFVDTPGIHKPDSRFNERMMETVRAALAERDLLIYVVDATASFAPADEEAVGLVRQIGTPTLLVLNKVDRLKQKEHLLLLIERYKSLHEFADFIPISALKRQSLDELRAAIIGRLPEGPAYFPPDYLTDQPERFLAGELIREKILRETRQEIPHAVAVIVEKWEDTKKLIRISATIYVEKDGQKGILIGTKGTMLKRIGTQSRLEMEGFLRRKIFLELFVKVRPNWRESPEFLNEMDWRSMLGKS